MSSNNNKKKESLLKSFNVAKVNFDENQLHKDQTDENQEQFGQKIAENINETIYEIFGKAELKKIERKEKLRAIYRAKESKVTAQESNLNGEEMREVFRMHLKNDERQTFSKCCEKYGHENIMKISEMFKVRFNDVKLEDESSDSEFEE